MKKERGKGDRGKNCRNERGKVFKEGMIEKSIEERKEARRKGRKGKVKERRGQTNSKDTS